jgi:hypothetical protein
MYRRRIHKQSLQAGLVEASEEMPSSGYRRGKG